MNLRTKSLRLNGSWADEIEIAIEGKLIRKASVADEWDVDIEDPSSLILDLKKSKVRADIFTFMQRIPETSPRFPYYYEWDNVAAIPIKSFEHWWRKQINDKVRGRVRRSNKKGVNIKISEYNDELVKGIMEIFNETPIRRGKPFSHYGETFETIKKEWRDRLNRATFIVAYYNNEVIGFIKLITTKGYTRTSGTVSKISHRNKSVMNAVIANAVKICAENKSPYLVYGKFDYGKKGSDSLSDFKMYNGFKKIELPRYYIPLTIKGNLALKLKLHHGVIEILPRRLIVFLIEMRTKFYLKKLAITSK